MEKPVELYVQMYMGKYMYKCIWGIICTNVYGELYVLKKERITQGCLTQHSKTKVVLYLRYY